MELTIRQAEQKDFDAIFCLLEQLWSYKQLDFSAIQNVYNIALESNTQKLTVSLVDNKIIGFCSLTINNNLWQAGNLGHIDELVIDQVYRRKGFGKNMIDHITEIARKSGCKRIELDSGFHRKEAHQFYESIGYENRAYLFSMNLM